MLSVLCNRDYNPFADVSNARAVVRHASFSDGDTLEIFSGDTLDVSVAVAEKVDSFSVHADHNRLFADTSIVLIDTDAEPLYRILCSFYDTGWQEISLVTHRRGAQAVTETYRVYTVSPLRQDTITGYFGDTVRLATTGVRASDVAYHWDFGRGSVFTTTDTALSVVVQDAAFSDTGYLWVSDLKGVHVSPRALFRFSLNDDEGPLVVCVNEGFVNRDTLLTGSSVFPFRVSVTDRGQGNVYLAEIDGGPFSIVQDPVYVKVYNGLDTLTDYLRVVVRAIDNAVYYNETRKEFFIGFDTSLVSHGEGVHIAVLIPPRDSLVFNTRERYLLGRVDNFTGDSVNLVVRFSVNGTAHAESVVLAGSATQFEWATTVMLGDQTNAVRIWVEDEAASRVADTSLTLIYNASALDETPPVIVEVSSGHKALDRLYTPDTSIDVRVVAFDEGTGISSVTINGERMSSSAGTASYIWELQVPLDHVPNGNVLAIVATDREGLSDTATATVFRNSAPRLVREPAPPVPLSVGDTYRDVILVDDEDRDAITMSVNRGPAGLSVTNSGVISWTPAHGDTGTHDIEILFTDKFQPQVYAYTVTVEDTADLTVPSFVTTEQDFPVYLEGGEDTLTLSLRIDSTRGSAPFTFSAVAEAGVSQPRLSGTALRWAPALGDTGYQRLIVAVNDAFGHGDTLAPVVLVVKPRGAFALVLSHSVDTLTDGTLNLNASALPETLTFTIVDTDHPLSEKYHVEMDSRYAAVMSGVDSARTFRVVLDPFAGYAGRDTVVVAMADDHGNTAADTVMVYYGSAPAQPSLVSPANASRVGGYAFELRWSGSDPDGDALSYVVYFDTSASFDSPYDTVTDTVVSVTVRKADRRHYWKVVASDGRLATSSPVWTFSAALFRRIIMNTTSTGANVSSTVNDFPVLVRLDDSNFDFADAQPGGEDIRFYENDGTELAYEIERWSAASQRAEMWVRVPTILGNTANQYVLMYYGSGQTQSGSDGAAVFDTAKGFVGVWHLDEQGTGSRKDATAYGNDGTPVNYDGDERVGGVIANADSSGDSTEYITMGNPPSLRLTHAITVSAWVKGFLEGAKIISKHDWGAGSNRGFSLYYFPTTAPANLGKVMFEISPNGLSGSTAWHVSTAVANAGAWNYVAASYDGSHTTTCVNGQCDQVAYSGGIHDTPASFVLKTNFVDGALRNTLELPLDEARVSRVARGTAWVKLCYENQRQGGALITVE